MDFLSGFPNDILRTAVSAPEVRIRGKIRLFVCYRFMLQLSPRVIPPERTDAVTALSRNVNSGDARISPAVRPPLSRRQLLIVRSDLAGHIQSFVSTRALPSRAFVSRPDVSCAWLATR